jgi:diguanylate cyclase (GGDEF)-like protein
MRAQNDKISFQASHDALTGLWNRSEFEAMATRLLHSAKVMQMHHALMYLDLDQFKIVNDTCGHLAGDQLLCQLSNLLLRHTRKSDMLARLGGDEFGILLDSCPADRATEIAQHIVDTVRAFRFEWEGKLFSVGVSIGLIFITDQTRDLQSLLSGADTACYLAKDKGRNRVQVFEPQDEEVQDRHVQMDWVTRINKAIDQNQFVLYFQKILPIDASEPSVNYEILLRYKAEDGRLLLPLAFIPAAERYGLLPAIDRWVISTVLRHPPVELLQHIANSPGKAFIAINLSSATINEPGFQEFAVNELEHSSIAAQQICFEIMETVAITNLHRVIEFIFTMKTRGCLFSLDDFGSGLSSFGYLKSLPVDYLKIDSAFVKDIAKDKIDCAMVESIQRISKVMGVKTIAKGVENAAVLHQLQTIGVNLAQGFGLHTPELLQGA